MHKQLSDVERLIMEHIAKHPGPANGRGYHAAPLRSAAWFDEQVLPSLLRAFSPAVLAREIERRLNRGPRSAKKPPRRGAGTAEENALAAWFVQRLFDLAENPKTPATTRLGAIERIREIAGHCAVALHPPLTEAVKAARKQAQEETDPPPSAFQQFLREQHDAAE